MPTRLLEKKSNLHVQLVALLPLVLLCLVQLNNADRISAINPLIRSGWGRSSERGNFDSRLHLDSDTGSESESEPSSDSDSSDDRSVNGHHGAVEQGQIAAPNNAIKSTKNIGGRIAEAANVAIAPLKSYSQLVRRYNKWRTDYNALQAWYGSNPRTGKPYFRDAIDVLRIEYAKMDRDLFREACEAQARAQPDGPQKPAQVENVDFILQVLKRLIDRLEARLEIIEQGGVKAIIGSEFQRSDAEAERDVEQIELQIKGASDRAKRIAARSTVKMAANELSNFIKIVAFNTLVNYAVKSNRATGPAAGIMVTLEPILMLMSTPNASLLVQYLRNVQFRATMNLLDYSVSLFTCGRKDPNKAEELTEASTH